MPHCFFCQDEWDLSLSSFLFHGYSKETSKQTLALVKLFFMAWSLLLTDKDLSDTVGILSLFFKSQSSYCQSQMAEAPQRAPKGCYGPPSPPRNKLEPWILPHQGRTQRNPPTSPPSITSLFFQAVTTCKAFPQAEHMDLIKCRSLTTLSCPNSLNCVLSQPTASPFITGSPTLNTFLQSNRHHFNISPQQNKRAQVCECLPIHSSQRTFTF